jgi:hypothetical protein
MKKILCAMAEIAIRQGRLTKDADLVVLGTAVKAYAAKVEGLESDEYIVELLEAYGVRFE